jgi:hypothetical protein
VAGGGVSDIVKRLRERADVLAYDRAPEPLMREAANEIETLRALLKHEQETRLREPPPPPDTRGTSFKGGWEPAA